MLYQTIVLLPAIGALAAGLFGKWLGPRGSGIVTCTLMVLTALLSFIAFYQVAVAGNVPEQAVIFFTWFDVGALEADWAIRVDTLTVVMFVVVNTVSSMVHIYSVGYMSHDPYRPRFFALLSMFTFAMLMLVTADNFLQLFFGWEGVGLASYLLIGFWYKKPSANAAAIKAFIVNRVGDFGFALGIMAIFFVFGSVDFDTVFAMAPSMAGREFEFLGQQFDILTTICLLLFMGAMGKSAQFLLHTWLPDAMEGPTPVSALIHAATMVTAGVFLVCRCSYLFEYAPGALAVVAVVGAVTAFATATMALVQYDIKRVIAYSTCSQLGYMFFAAGVGAYDAAMFHLFTHAFFKALLFLGAGSVIHGLGDEQDMRKMGGLAKQLPWTAGLMIIGTLAITGVGIPYTIVGFAGFVSKDVIIETAYEAATAPGLFAFWMGLTAVAMTSFYSWRVIFMTFFGKSRAGQQALEQAHESPAVMMIPLIILALGAVFAGAAFHSFFVGAGQEHFWQEALLFVGDEHAVAGMADGPALPRWVVWGPFAMMLVGLVWSYHWYIRRPDIPQRIADNNGILYRFLLNKWYFDEIYDFLFVEPTKKLGHFLWKQGDGWLIDGFGPDGVATSVLATTRRIVKVQTGYVYHYAFVMLIGIALFVTYYYVRSVGAF
ncbi:MAG: NADH-quinone oxidoreductase subunit L [Alphaproteobacteria bacterium]|nr:MAG: NADH-quinone oxidoreductase subunit L [Alphaproteobacteria bacterium]